MALEKVVSYGGGEACARGLNWLVLALLPLILPTAAFGVVGLVVALERMGSGILILGQDRAVLRFYDADADGGNLLYAVLLVACGAPLLVLGGGILVASSFSRTFYGVPYFPDLLLLALVVPLFNAYRIYLAVLRIEDSVWQFVRIRVLSKACKLGLVIGLAYAIQTSSAYVIGELAALLFILIWTGRSFTRRIRPSLKREQVKQLWVFGWPLIFHVLGGNIAGFVDRFMLQSFVDVSAVGIYTFGFTIGSGITFAYNALATYFEPSIYRSVGDRDASERKLAEFAMTAILCAAVMAAGLVLIFPYVIKHVVGEDYALVLTIFPTIVAGYLINSIYLQANYRLTLHQKTKLLATGTALAAVTNVAGNLILIPMQGIAGAANATFISYLIQAGYLFYVSIRVTGLTVWRYDRYVTATFLLLIVSMSAVVLGGSRWLLVICAVVVGFVSAGYLVLANWNTKRRRSNAALARSEQVPPS